VRHTVFGRSQDMAEAVKECRKNTERHGLKIRFKTMFLEKSSTASKK